jgi:hypothetical protein
VSVPIFESKNRTFTKGIGSPEKPSLTVPNIFVCWLNPMLGIKKSIRVKKFLIRKLKQLN